MGTYVFYVTVDSCFAFCKKEFWEENHCLDDRHDRELYNKLTALGFAEVRTAQYARPAFYSVDAAIKLLKQNEFVML